LSSANENLNIAIFCDFENIALGVRDAKIAKFDIQLVLERLLLKGTIVTKKAYCDWERYKEFKPVMHDAAFELIDIPHRRQTGKNSADIRMVVDALDLCYTKEHIDTFVIVSGDSDFSPLVSKLRENNKLVIGVGVKSSTSDSKILCPSGRPGIFTCLWRGPTRRGNTQLQNLKGGVMIFFIPARKGSIRVKDKNMRPLAGKPIRLRFHLANAQLYAFWIR